MSGSTRRKRRFARGLSPAEVVQQAREQNRQVPGRAASASLPFPWGKTSSTPSPRRRSLATELPKVRRSHPQERERLHGQAQGSGPRAEQGIELGAKNYDVGSYLDGDPSVTLAVFQLPGSNALDTAKANSRTR